MPETQDSELPAEPRWRQKLRGSRWATLGILAVTALAVVGGLWLAHPGWFNFSGNGKGIASSVDGKAADGKVSVVDVGAGEAPRLGEVPPNFPLELVAGDPIAAKSLEDLRGKPVWVVFAATWCSGCRVEMPDIAAAAAKHGDDLQVVVVYLGEEPNAVMAFQERTGLRLSALADSDSKISATWGIMGIPAHFFLDRDGVLRATRVGVLSPEVIEKALTKVTSATAK